MQLTNDPKTNIALVKEAAAKVYPDNKVLADLTVAQAILESNLLKKPSFLASEYNNLFGIKGLGTAGAVSLLTTEYVKGKPIKIMQPFASNNTLEDSIEQHKKLLENGTKDKPKRYQKVLDAKQFETAAREIRLAGYATDPAYTKLLIEIWHGYIK